MTSILDQVTFVREKNEVIAIATPQSTPEAGAIIETLNELGDDEHAWQPAIDTIDGKHPFPYWFGGDSMEIKVETDGTWFRVLDEMHPHGTKLLNSDARELMKRFIEVGRKLKS